MSLRKRLPRLSLIQRFHSTLSLQCFPTDHVTPISMLLLALIHTAEQNCSEMAEFGVVSPLVGLLSSPVRATRSYTTLCLSVMTTSGRPKERRWL